MPKPLTVWITTNWKILKEMRIPDHLTWLLRNLYAGQEATVRTGHGTIDWFQIGKGVRQGCILSPCLFNFYAEYIMWNARLAEARLESRLLEEISVTSDVQMTPPLWQEVKKSLLMKEESEKVGLKLFKVFLKLQKTKIMAYSPITSWHIDGETMETVTELIFFWLQNHCRWWLQLWN